MAKKISFVGGGRERRSPLVAVPVGARERWRDDVGAKWTQAAKAVRGVGVITVDRSPALVLGPLETGTTCMPDEHGVVLVRWLDGRGYDHEAVPLAAATVERTQWGWTDHVLHIEKPTTFALFAAAISDGAYGEKWPFGPLGKEDHPFGFVTFTLERAGHYGVEVTRPFTAHGVTLELVRLRHADANDHALGPATAKRAPATKKKITKKKITKKKKSSRSRRAPR